VESISTSDDSMIGTSSKIKSDALKSINDDSDEINAANDPSSTPQSLESTSDDTMIGTTTSSKSNNDVLKSINDHSDESEAETNPSNNPRSLDDPLTKIDGETSMKVVDDGEQRLDRERMTRMHRSRKYGLTIEFRNLGLSYCKKWCAQVFTRTTQPS
jgi:hypothetical protein